MKCPGELFDGLLPDAVLYVQVVLGHVDVRVTDDALDGRQIHAESLHLRHVGVSAVLPQGWPPMPCGTDPGSEWDCTGCLSFGLPR